MEIKGKGEGHKNGKNKRGCEGAWTGTREGEREAGQENKIQGREERKKKNKKGRDGEGEKEKKRENEEEKKTRRRDVTPAPRRPFPGARKYFWPK